MDVILISFTICLLGVMVTVLLFTLSMGSREEDGDQVRPREHPVPQEGFFMEETDAPSATSVEPTNSLLMVLERHVQMEQKAAEAFLEHPDEDSLHAPSESPLWN